MVEYFVLETRRADSFLRYHTTNTYYIIMSQNLQNMHKTTILLQNWRKVYGAYQEQSTESFSNSLRSTPIYAGTLLRPCTYD